MLEASVQPRSTPESSPTTEDAKGPVKQVIENRSKR